MFKSGTDFAEEERGIDATGGKAEDVCLVLRVDLHRARAGMRLALPVYNPKNPDRILLTVGFELTGGIIDKLKSHGIRSIWVRYPSFSFLEKFINRETVEKQGKLVGQIARTFETLQRGASAKLPYDTYTKTIGDMVDHLVSHPRAAVFLGDIDHASDDLMRHSSAVTYLSILMGLKLEAYIVRERPHVSPARAKEVRNLGLGAMLHDVGVTQLTSDVRERYRQTGDESDPEWREHPALGYGMVQGKIDASAATVVLHHHQRFDGTGFAGGEYPVQLERSIHIFARIAAAADQLDMLRHPPGGPEQTTAAALRTMLCEPMVRGFDPQVLEALVAVVPPYPPGSIIRLSDGRRAVCIDHNPEQPCRPKVQILPEPSVLEQGDPEAPESAGPTIDLARQSRRLFVTEAEGQKVDKLNFEAPQFFVPA